MTEREQFEKWISTRKLCTKYGAKLDRLTDGQYRDVRVRGHFVTWQAARAASPKVPQDGYAEGWTDERRAMLNGALETKVPQGVEEWLVGCEHCATIENNVLAFNMASNLRAYLSGMVIVPVDDLEAIVEVVRGMLHAAYQNAMPVCCGKPGQQCCGNPDPEWNAADIEVMDSLGPVEKRISAMLAATKEKGE